ncbi:MAG: DUF1015 family protein [Kiritimatiellae bacterium]|nr:DUF1015 family protein [Kiritimatiellia bacterium]
MRIKPFKALKPPPEWAAQVASLPYDVISSEEARTCVRNNPKSFLRVIKPEIDLSPEISLYHESVYAKAVENFELFQQQGFLQQDKEEAIYVYRQIIGDHVQYGLMTVCHVEDYENGLIKKHEDTIQKKEDDRTQHVAALNANAGPIFLAYHDSSNINERVEAITTDQPLYDFAGADGVQHTVWKVADSEDWVKTFSEIPSAYIADGHHRSASAVRVAQDQRARNPHHLGTEEYNWFLAVLFPASQLKILGYHRCIRDLGGLEADQFLEKIKEPFDVIETDKKEPKTAGHITMYLNGQWFNLTWARSAYKDPVSRLDVSILQNKVLSPLLDIHDPRHDPRIEFVGGIRGPEELVRRVDSGDHAVAFCMYPTAMDQLIAVADAGLIMPPKSTWFEPKLKSGLLVHTLD